MAGKKDRGPKKKVKGTHVYSAPGKPVRKKKKLNARQRRKRNEAASARKYRERVAAQKERTRLMKENQAARATQIAQNGTPNALMSRDPEYDAWAREYHASIMSDDSMTPKEKQKMLGGVKDFGKDIPKGQTPLPRKKKKTNKRKK